MAGVFVPFAWNVIYISNLIPIYRIDLTPAAFTITGIILAWGLFKLRLFDIVPIAYDIIIEGMSDGIIVVDVRDRIVDINHTGEQIIDRSLSSALGQPIATALSEQPELVKSVIGFTGGRTETTIKTIETDGSEKYYRVTISLLFDKHEHLRGRLIQIHDMTQDQRDKLMKNELEERAHQLSRLTTVGKMAAGIVHEVNNPLAAVVGYADWLKGLDLADSVKADLEIIIKGAQTASGILDRLLIFASQRQIEWDYLDINAIIDIAIEFQKYSLLNHNIEVIKEYDENLPKTMVDGSQLQEVFLNLIINAEGSMIEYHQSGKLNIKTESINGHIRVSFQDDGAGISKETLQKVFDPFFTTKEVGKGTGLGLSICHGIISEHKGRIYAESVLGEGATFIIELPVSDKKPDAG